MAKMFLEYVCGFLTESLNNALQAGFLDSLISAAASRLCLLQLLLPDCVCISCCPPIMSVSAAAPQLSLDCTHSAKNKI